MQKNTIREVVKWDFKWELDGMTLREAVDYFASLHTEYGDEVKLDFTLNHDECTLELIHTRAETDEEAAKRQAYALALFLRKEQQQLAEDLRQFEALKARLGK